MVLKDDPYSNEASSAAGLVPKTEDNQSHRGYTGATVTKQRPSASLLYALLKLKTIKICLLLNWRFRMLNLQIHSMCFKSVSRDHRAAGRLYNLLGLLEKQHVVSKAHPPPDSSAWTTLLDVLRYMTGRCCSVLGPIALFFLDHGESK